MLYPFIYNNLFSLFRYLTSRTLVLQAPTRAEHRFWVRNLVQLAINAVYKGSTLTGMAGMNRP
jgi:hypothetical protein